MNPATFLRSLGPEPWKYCNGLNPVDAGLTQDTVKNPKQIRALFSIIRLCLKTSPNDAQELYLKSLEAMGHRLSKHDVRFVEDNWESTDFRRGRRRLEVWLDGMEITQFTYFQQVGGLEIRPVALELTYGLERIAMYLQNVNSVFWRYVEQRTENTEKFIFKTKLSSQNIILRCLMPNHCSKMFDLYQKRGRKLYWEAIGSGRLYDYVFKMLAYLQFAWCKRGYKQRRKTEFYQPNQNNGGSRCKTIRGTKGSVRISLLKVNKW